MKAFLILEDGHVFSGTSVGSSREVISEIVFNTISLITSLDEPMLVQVNTSPSSNIRHAFIQSPFLYFLVLS